MPGFEIIDEEERKQVQAVMEAGILSRYGFENSGTEASRATSLEHEISRWFGMNYCQLVSSGSAALITALAALNIGAGHEVILPAFCHVSCFEAIVSVGAIPVFADIDESLTINPAGLEDIITGKTRALLLVHTAGNMAEADSIKKICEEKGIFLVEDISRSIGTTYRGRPAGTFGDIGVFSMDAYSTVTCGEGGAIITDDASLYKLCNEYSDHGHDHLGTTRREDLHKYMGTGFRISELHAAVGLAQIRKLPEILGKQRRLHRILEESLQGISGVRLCEIPDRSGSSGAYLSILLPGEIEAAKAIRALETEKIPFAYWYENNWHYIQKWEHFKNGSWMNRLYDDQKQHILQNTNRAFPVSDAVMNRCISFAVSLKWSEKEAGERGSRIASALKNIFK